MSHSYEQVEKKQNDFMLQIDRPKQFSIWKHYKGEFYLVRGFAMKESTEEIEICYSNITSSLPYPWCRSLVEWNEMVEYEGKSMRRFTKVVDPDNNVFDS